MIKPDIENCPECDKVVHIKTDGKITLRYENYQKTILHDTHKCYAFKHYKRLFEKLEDDLSILREDLKEINAVMFH